MYITRTWGKTAYNGESYLNNTPKLKNKAISSTICDWIIFLGLVFALIILFNRSIFYIIEKMMKC